MQAKCFPSWIYTEDEPQSFESPQVRFVEVYQSNQSYNQSNERIPYDSASDGEESINSKHETANTVENISGIELQEMSGPSGLRKKHQQHYESEDAIKVSNEIQIQEIQTTLR